MASTYLTGEGWARMVTEGRARAARYRSILEGRALDFHYARLVARAAARVGAFGRPGEEILAHAAHESGTDEGDALTWLMQEVEASMGALDDCTRCCGSAVMPFGVAAGRCFRCGGTGLDPRSEARFRRVVGAEPLDPSFYAGGAGEIDRTEAILGTPWPGDEQH